MTLAPRSWPSRPGLATTTRYRRFTGRNTRQVPPHPIQTTWDDHLTGGDPLGWPGYSPPAEESVVTGRTRHYAFVEGRFDVLGGSMGAAHGEKVVRALPTGGRGTPADGGAELRRAGRACRKGWCRSSRWRARRARRGALRGGAPVAGRPPRSDDGRGARVVRVARRPLGRRPGAVIGFAGPRVVELTTGERLPEASHTAESAYANGLVDALVSEGEEGGWIDLVLGIDGTAAAGVRIRRRRPAARRGGVGRGAAGAGAASPHRQTVGRPALRVLGRPARHRPHIEGGPVGDRRSTRRRDRRRPPGPAGPGGHQQSEGGQAPARGLPPGPPRHPLAGRLGLPLLTFVDTAGADPGPDAEAEGIAREIALTFAAMDGLATPSVSVCVGEGGSGGALALAYADRLLIQEHAIFSVIAPEGAAAILERDAAKAPELAARLRLTSADLLDLGIVDEVVREDSESMCRTLIAALDAARPGDRRRRFDEVTARWLG